MAKFRRKNKNKKKAYDNANNKEGQKKEPYHDGFPQRTVEQGNFKMEAYYALQGLHDHLYDETGTLVPCQTDDEKNEERLRWRKSIGTILPASFRIACDISESLQARLEAELEALIVEQKKEASSIAAATAEATAGDGQTEEMGTEDLDPDRETFKKLSFLPHAYQLYSDKKSIKKDPTMKKIHNWLRNQTDAGFITRQETVSMVPPVVLAPQPDDVVFDMCAAPGSKTCQILEKLSPNGAMLANDSSSARAYMLVHQLRRIMHNNPVCMVTSCDAQFFPQTLSFDRILADVPCSGDGTR